MEEGNDQNGLSESEGKGGEERAAAPPGPPGCCGQAESEEGTGARDSRRRFGGSYTERGKRRSCATSMLATPVVCLDRESRLVPGVTVRDSTMSLSRDAPLFVIDDNWIIRVLAFVTTCTRDEIR